MPGSVEWHGLRRTLVAGAVAVVAGAIAIAVTWLSLGFEDWIGFAGHYGVPLANRGLHLLGLGKLSTRALPPGIGTVTVAAFVIGIASTALGSCLLVIGAARVSARWAPRRRARAGWQSARPHVARVGERWNDAQPTVKAIGNRGRTEAKAGAAKAVSLVRAGRDRLRRDRRDDRPLMR